MHAQSSLDHSALGAQAARYFDRPSYSMPTFIDDVTLAILDDRTGVPQLSLINTGQTDPVPATSFGERILTLSGTRRGQIVFGMDTGGDENQQLWAYDIVSEASTAVTSNPLARHEAGPIAADGESVFVKSNSRDDSIFDIVEISLTTGAVRMLWESAGTAMPVAVDSAGARLLVVKTNANLDADLWLIDLKTGDRRNLTIHTGEAWILGAVFAPNADEAWFLTNENREFVRLESIDLQNSSRRVVLENADHDIEAFSISPDGRQFIVAINNSGWSEVEIHSIGERTPNLSKVDLPRGTVDRFTWNADSSNVAFGFSTAEDPSSIVVVDNKSNAKVIGGEVAERRPPVAEPELVEFASFDDRKIPGFLFRPEGDGPFPVLVEIHGGPESQRRLQYSSAVPTDQFIQSLGIAVLSLNIRGSIGYGKEYSHLDDKEKRLDCVKDVEASVSWIKSQPWARPDRIAVMGQSYGGYMTLASIAFLPDLWTAAVDVVGIANFVSFLERTGAWRRQHRSEEYGFLETDREMLAAISPINHVDQIRTPLYVIHGRNDPRVPLFEAEQIVAALSARRIEVELQVFDNEGHGLSKRNNRINGYAAAAGFLAKHLLV